MCVNCHTLHQNPSFQVIKILLPSTLEYCLKRLGNSKHHTQHDIINNIAPWASFTLIMLHSRKENFSYALHKPHEQKELQGITHHYILYSYHSFIYFI